MEEETMMEEGENSRGGEVSPALIAVHPLHHSVVVAIGSELRVFDLLGDCPTSLVDGSGGPLHSDSIRSICFGASGKLFASAGDDKLVKIWTTSSWQCLRTVCSEKRVSALAISHDDTFVSFADKFGVVWVIGLEGDGETNDKAAPILSHYCSIITGLEFSPDGRFIVSADRDFKIRVSVFPKKPLNGAHEIQSFCLGHTEFVSCLSFVCNPAYPEGFLLSGSGDSTVRLWDVTSGSLLDTCEVGLKAGLLESIDGKEAICHAVTDICTSSNGSLVAVAIQSLHGVMLLSCDLCSKTLSVLKVESLNPRWNKLTHRLKEKQIQICLDSFDAPSIHSIPQSEYQVVSMVETFIPTSLAMCSSAEKLWMVTGASNLPASDSPSLARVRVISGIKKNVAIPIEPEPVVLEDDKIPGGVKLLKKLQGCAYIAREEKALAAAAEAVKIAMCNLLIKRQYSVEKRELRKKSRNDRKLKE